MPLLCLDLGTKLGWAVRKADGFVASGTEDFTPKSGQRSGVRFRKFKLFLQELKDASGGELDGVYFEKAAGTRWKSAPASAVYFGMLAILQEWCEMYSIPCADINPATLKKWLTGNGRAEKVDIINELAARGHYVEGHNEADALAVMLWAIETQPKD